MNLEETSLNSTELESIAIIFDKVRALFKYREFLKFPKSQIEKYQADIQVAQHKVDEELASDFDHSLTNHMTDLNQKLEKSDNLNYK